MRWLKLWWPALVWAVVISSFSTSVFSSEHTSRIIIPLLHWLLPHASPEALAELHHLIRKCAHFVEYFILSLLVLRGLRAGRKDTHLRWALVAIGIVAGYAALDEYHQSFVPGRGAAVADVLLDTAGGIAAQIVAALVMLWGDVREKQRAKTAGLA
ncbi:MAG TPA: VanZ family protein [Candidatus Limnocylindria bacterium]|nr:VanZ family protein [Candidatus Limnocylindria bacterium]